MFNSRSIRRKKAAEKRKKIKELRDKTAAAEKKKTEIDQRIRYRTAVGKTAAAGLQINVLYIIAAVVIYLLINKS